MRCPRAGPGSACAKGQLPPILLPRRAAHVPPPRLVKGSKAFMRGQLLLMENFNDWDLQAVVRSCSFSHPHAGDRYAAARQAGAGAPETAPAPTPPGEQLERAAPSCAQVADRGPARLAPAAGMATDASRMATDASLLYDLEYLDLDRKPFLLPPTTSSRAPAPAPARAGDDSREVMISFPAAAASGMQPRAVPPGRKPGARTPRPKRSKKSQLKKVVREMPVADGGASSSDPWAWRKYGQKPIKGSPYPRGYYKCSSMKGCMARKLVERSPAKPGVLIVTYMAEHCHPAPTQLNALAGTTRHNKSSSAAAEDHPALSSRSHEGGPAAVDDRANEKARCDVDNSEASTAPMAAEWGAEETAAAADDDNEFWPARMELDELLAPVDDDFDFDFDHVTEEDGVLGRRLSL
ncbi:probable WRKY transcription factor 27 [Phragmites australis]|uniref:probable WRKY transcription factor 27 n=1 Tax=Phragmites australis TaxID=29695 RepID=UPI002D798F73|nr:probable WRKY transcription factor 27 [Phragmites australis]